MLKMHIFQKNTCQTSQKCPFFSILYVFSTFQILWFNYALFQRCFTSFFPKSHGKNISKIKINEPVWIRLSAIFPDSFTHILLFHISLKMLVCNIHLARSCKYLVGLKLYRTIKNISKLLLCWKQDR